MLNRTKAAPEAGTTTGTPAAAGTDRIRLLRAAAALSLGAGLVGWGIGGDYPTLIALWCFVACAVAVALALPFPLALVSPLFMGLAGWLVDMLPLVILAGWASVSVRWLWTLWGERRMPRGGRWVLLSVGLLAWTGTGLIPIVVSGFEDFKHFLLLVGIQFVVSSTLLAVVDQIGARREEGERGAALEVERKAQIVSGLALFVTIMSAGVLLQWLGVPIGDLRDPTARRNVEAAYGLDAFPNSVGMIKYARSVEPGTTELGDSLRRVGARTPGLPDYEVFRPRLQAYENSLVVRFSGSARSFDRELSEAGVTLVFDNVGLAPANTVPRLRSFPRNALTYAGVCAALFPLTLWLAWSFQGRRRLLGRLGAASCLFGAAFSLARGSWVVIALAVAYLVMDGVLSTRRKLQTIGAVAAAAVVVTGVFLVNYGVDPVTGRAGGGASVNTRSDLYGDTIDAVANYHLVIGYGTERPRLETGRTRAGHSGGEYVPRAGTHSTYLNYLFRTGVLGVVLIALVYLFAGLAARAAARATIGARALFFTTAAAAVVTAAAHAVILSLYVEPTYTLAISLILGLAVAGATDLGRPLLPWRSDDEVGSAGSRRR